MEYKSFFTKTWFQVNYAFSLAKKNITRSKYRSILIVFGILLTVALETGIAISIDTLYDDFILDNRNNNFTDITVITPTWSNISDLRRIAANITTVQGIAKASPVYSLQERRMFSASLAESKILIYGIDANTHPDFPFLNLTQGNRMVKGNTIIVSESIVKMTGIDVGEEVTTLASAGIEFNFTIGGVISDLSFFGNNIGFSFILADIEALYDAIPENQKKMLSPKIDVQIEDFLAIKKVSDNLKDHLDINYHVRIEKVVSPLKITGIKSYQAAMNVVILASFVVEFLFITNILAISVKDRSREIGILRAVGSSTRQLIEVIAIEVLIYAILGSFLGMIGGISFAFILLEIMQSFYPSLVVEQLALHPMSLLATFISGIIVALTSGLYPIFIAISMPVIQNIHSRVRRGEGRVSQYFPIYWKYTIGMGVLLALTGFILQFFIGPSRFLAFEVLSIHFLVILCIFIGTLFVEIGLLYFLPKFAFKALIWFSPVTRTIAMRNIAREFQKSLFTIMTSTLSLTFIVLVGLVSAAVVEGVPGFFETQWGGVDIIAEGQEGNLPLDFSNNINAIKGITKSCFIQEQRTMIDYNLNSYVFGVDYSEYKFFAESVIDSLNFDFSADDWLNQSSYGNHNTHGSYAVVSDLLQQKLLISIGSSFSVMIGTGQSVNVTIAAIIKSNAFLQNGEYLYLSSNRFQEFFNSTNAKWLLCEVDGEIDKVVDQLWRFPYFKDIIQVEYFSQMMKRSLTFQSVLFQVLFIESFILAAITQFICILVSTLRMEREVGIIRSLGLDKKGVLTIFLAESTALGITAAFLGLIDGLLGANLLGWYISLSIPIRIELTLNYVILWILFSILVTQISAFIPSYRSSRRNIVAAISGRPLMREHRDSYKIRDFLIDNSSQLQVSFFFLLGVFSCAYVFNNSLKIIGLVPLDLIVIFPFVVVNLELFNDISTELNLFSIVLGLTSLAPLSYLIAHEKFPKGFGKELFKSLVFGLLGIVIATCSLMILLLINISIVNFLSIEIVLTKLNENLDWLSANIVAILIQGFIILSFLGIFSLELLIFQRVWLFLVIRGMIQSQSLKEQIILVVREGSRGQLIMIVLFLIHLLFQFILINFNRVVETISNDPYILFKFPLLILLHSTMFLMTATIDIGFYIFLVTLPVFIFKNQIRSNNKNLSKFN